RHPRADPWPCADRHPGVLLRASTLPPSRPSWPAKVHCGPRAGYLERSRMMRIVAGDFADPRVIDLLRVHLATARAHTAPGSAHALDLAGLQSPDISFWTIWADATLAGCGALKRLAADHGEVKSMHTAEAMRRKGVGSAMLGHIIATA